MPLSERLLSGTVVALSVSESEDNAARGFPTSETNRAVLRLMAALLGHGAKIVLGHDWRDDGLMEAVYGYITRYQSDAENARVPLVMNVLPWPDKPRLNPRDRRNVGPGLAIKTAGLPSAIARYSRAHQTENNALRPIALTHLRRRLTNISDVRVCIGGRLTKYQGRYPGVVEEALLSVRANKPLYLIGMWGGATEGVIRALHDQAGRPFFSGARTGANASLASATAVRAVLRDHKRESPRAVAAAFRKYGIQSLAHANRLSVAENERLFHAQTLDETIEIALTGIHRCMDLSAGGNVGRNL